MCVHVWLFVYLSVCLSEFVHVCVRCMQRCPWNSEESIRSCEARATGPCEILEALGLEFASSARRAILQLGSHLSSLHFSLLKKDIYKKSDETLQILTHSSQLILFLPLLQNDKRPSLISLWHCQWSQLCLKRSRQKNSKNIDNLWLHNHIHELILQ